MMTLKQLVRIAPFDEETRTLILNSEESLTPDQKREIIELAASLMGEEQQHEIDTRVDAELDKVAKGDKQFSPDFTKKIIEELDFDMKKKSHQAETDTEIASIQQSLQVTQPNSRQLMDKK